MSEDTHAADTNSNSNVYAGRVVLTFPVAAPGQPVPTWGITIWDYDTGEQIVDAYSLSLVVGDEGNGWLDKPLEVELTRLVDADGKPIGAGRQPVMTDEYREHVQREREQRADLPFDGHEFLTGRFRYLVVGPAEQ